MKNRPVVRPATAEDIELFFPNTERPTIKAWVGELDGKLIGIGGFALCDGRWYGFCDITDDARRFKVSIVKAAKMIMDEAKKQDIRFVYVGLDESEPGAARWIESLGFKLDPKTMFLYRWKQGGVE